ncbi:MAG: DUF3098 domain-containing protein [Flavobacteriales bacterium]|nr:DUF3098 domain-containing protein [Flavobacteriales bacterium]
MAKVPTTQKDKKNESLLDEGIPKSNEPQSVENKFALGKLNYLFIILGVLIVVVGFVLMSGGGSEDPTIFNEEELFHPTRITVAPITVIFGYLVVIFAIMKKPKR